MEKIMIEMSPKEEDVMKKYANYMPMITCDGILTLCLPESLVMKPEHHLIFLKGIERNGYTFNREVWDVNKGVVVIFTDS